MTESCLAKQGQRPTLLVRDMPRNAEAAADQIGAR